MKTINVSILVILRNPTLFLTSNEEMSPLVSALDSCYLLMNLPSLDQFKRIRAGKIAPDLRKDVSCRGQ